MLGPGLYVIILLVIYNLIVIKQSVSEYSNKSQVVNPCHQETGTIVGVIMSVNKVHTTTKKNNENIDSLITFVY